MITEKEYIEELNIKTKKFWEKYNNGIELTGGKFVDFMVNNQNIEKEYYLLGKPSQHIKVDGGIKLSELINKLSNILEMNGDTDQIFLSEYIIRDVENDDKGETVSLIGGFIQ